MIRHGARPSRGRLPGRVAGGPALAIAREILERVLRIDPRCDWALRQLIVSMTLAQRWDALLAV